MKNSTTGRRRVKRGSVLCLVRQEMRVIQERDPAIKKPAEALLYPGFRALLYYRFAHKLWIGGHIFLARALSQSASRATGIEIHPGAVIGKGFFIDHGSGVIIGETTEIGNNVTIYQGVTLGGTGKEQGKRHPTIGNNVLIGAGAKLLGPITVHDNCRIGAGSVVLRNVPENCTVVGVPGRIVRRNDQKVPNASMDQMHLPDPVREDILKLRREVEKLKKERSREIRRQEERTDSDGGR